LVEPAIDAPRQRPADADRKAAGSGPLGRPEQVRHPLAISIVTQEDPFYIPCFFRSFLKILADNPGRVLLREVVLQPSFAESKLALAKRLLGFYGWADFVRLVARYAGQKGALALEQMKLRKDPVSIAGICARSGIPVRVEEDINHERFIEHVRASGIDLLVSVSAPQIFRAALLRTPRLGCVNIHNGKLPDYRGMLPNFWQMLNGEPYSTTTVHTMVQKLDAGEVLWEEKTPILPHASLDGLIRETKARSAEALWHVLEILARGDRPTVIREIRSEGAYYTFPKIEHARALRRKGHALL
jgi:methionyl-tRNA formyltransferase